MPNRRSAAPRQLDTSWQKVSRWYQKSVGEKGQYYHQHVVIPGILGLLKLDKNAKLLDVGCGQGVLARAFPADLNYWGVDLSRDLIQFAQKQDHAAAHHYFVADATKKIPIPERNFTHAIFVLSLQNMSEPAAALRNVSEVLAPGGELILVLNHPTFRIPRQSSWGVDDSKKTQYRRIDRYLSAMKIPIEANPGQKQKRSVVTWSFHFPLSEYAKFLREAGFAITHLEEWNSDKSSEGKAAKMENRSRSEFPLFLTIVARKFGIFSN
jgi:ubiquinone/menaquinone biosynthesis C-methylase UbiE